MIIQYSIRPVALFKVTIDAPTEEECNRIALEEVKKATLEDWNIHIESWNDVVCESAREVTQEFSGYKKPSLGWQQ